jgi:hypothetical protein
MAAAKHEADVAHMVDTMTAISGQLEEHREV